MSLWSRVANVFRSDRLNRELDEELQSHIDEAVAAGRDPEEVRRAFGPALRAREDSRDIKVAAWLDSLRSDVVFGWRQLLKRKVSSGAAALSLALTVGACTSAFRLADAVLFRPLPVTDARSLFFLEYQFMDDRTGQRSQSDSFEYPLFRELRAAAKDDAEMMAISYAISIDLNYGSDQETEKAYRQYCSGWMFDSFGIRPALGRLLTAADDVKPGAHPYAVLSYDYWTSRFARDPKVIGRTFRESGKVFEIVGVSQKGFTGTETGTMTDVFVPTMMNAKAIDDADWSWFRTWVRLKPGASAEQVRQKIRAAFVAHRRERAKAWAADVARDRVDEYVNAPLAMQSASAGASGMQRDLRRPLAILAVVVFLVLLIACANIANLMTAQAESRSREMALRVSIGAGRWRLAQLVLVESAMLSLASSVLGGIFAWWSVPIVVGMMSGEPARLALHADWRVLAFAAAIAVSVTFLFGLAPALKASSVKPMSALRGGEDPHRKRRLMNVLLAAQMAFCFIVNLMAGLFVTTFDRLSKQPTGFAVDRVLTLETVSRQSQQPAVWNQVLDQLRRLNGVESAAICGWPLMSGNGWSGDVWVDGRPPERLEPYFLGISPGWLATMKVQLVDGRDLTPGDAYPDVAVVNQTFARHYFAGQNPVGRSFAQKEKGKVTPTRIVGLVADARYRDMREPIRPTIYVPFNSKDPKTGNLRAEDWATFVVRTSVDPLTLASTLRREIPRARSEFRVSNIRTQRELVEQHTVRERLLATLSTFFAILALVLAAVGLYGVLYFSVVQRQREIGIRLALGARAAHVARQVTSNIAATLLIGSACGLAASVALERYVHALLYEVKATEPSVLASPAIVILAAAFLAAIPPVIRALRIDPAVILRGD